MNVDFQPHLPNEFIQLSPCMLKKKKKRQWPSLNSNVQVSRQPKCMQFCKLKFWVRNANGNSSDFFFCLNRHEPWLLVSSHDTAKLFCMLDIPKDTPLLLLIYSDLSEFISGYYAKFFCFKMYRLGKNQFSEHECFFIKFCFPFFCYFKSVLEW